MDIVITSGANPAVKAAAKLKDKKSREASGLFLAEGKRILTDVADASRVAEIFVLDGKPALRALADSFGCPVRVVAPSVFKQLSDTVSGEGIVAVVKTQKPNPEFGSRVLLLDHVSDPTNVGTLLRSAKAFGFDTVIGVGSADFYNPKTVRGSMGAAVTLNLAQASEDEVEQLAKGYDLFAADMNGEEVLTVTPPTKLILAVGNEARGISDKIVALATKFVKISMPGAMESLNASVAGSIIMYHLK